MVWQSLRYFIRSDVPYTEGNKNPSVRASELFVICTTKPHSEVSVYVLLYQKLLHCSNKHQTLLFSC